MKTRVISVINMKGGVAKTTTTVGLATVLAGTTGKRILVIDLDPQTNSTVMLIGEEKWKELNDNGRTLYTLFHDALYNGFDFNLPATLCKNVSGIDEVKTLDLVPSSLDLIEIQDNISFVGQNAYGGRPYDIIKDSIGKCLPGYDYVFIDCPPNLGLITLNGLRISDGYIIPTVPDILSTYGIPQIMKHVKLFSAKIGREIKCFGIVITKMRQQSKLHAATIGRLRESRNLPPVFDTIFAENSRTGEAAQYVSVGTLRDKWGGKGKGQYEEFKRFGEEVMKAVGDNG